MFRLKPLTASLMLLLGFVIAGMPLLAMAQNYNPPKRGLPGRREGAGTRGTCMQGQKGLMPLTPMDGFSATTSNTPTFLWYVPPTKARTAEFALLDANDQKLYQSTLNLTGEGGVVGFRVPEAVAASVLESDKDFYWQFSIICDPNQPSNNPFVEGVVQRIKPDSSLAAQLKNASPKEQATLYAGAGIWQDAIAILAHQRCINPQDSSLQTSWTNLLTSVQLKEFAQEPLTQICSSINSSTGSIQP
ncbi:DUF928 domain-containing protein [Kovacikia minuta CCNUW1]|uniref:DUF928 domain-containing protein n=1 Tax=Kovacikia minuta TaxID=2931930 RepID=UPI001CCD0D50|nr:DUF928 domain-containing protein [Kovacikia minuta]UBF28045.1 DUF928 domain-containing protein [Kovacikia minuta CCNUW1]